MLSEFAGAAAELNGAVTVNPYDIDGVADSIHRALSMSVEERARADATPASAGLRARCARLGGRTFLEQLHVLRPVRVARPPRGQLSRWSPLLGDAQRTMKLRLLLDYDGTFVPLARSPEFAAPDDDLLLLLRTARRSPGIHVDIVSGRPHETSGALVRGPARFGSGPNTASGIVRGPGGPGRQRYGGRRMDGARQPRFWSSSPPARRDLTSKSRAHRSPGTIAAPRGSSVRVRPTSCGCCWATC